MRYGQETITSITRSLWSKLPKEYKLSKSSNSFKRKIKNWKGNAKLSPVVYAKLFKKILVLNNVILLVCLSVCFFVCLLVLTTCFIVIVTFLQFPILWRE